MYLLTTLTTYVISSLVHIMAYIRLMLAEVYGVLFVCSCSSSIFDNCCLNSMNKLANGMLTSFYFFYVQSIYDFFNILHLRQFQCTYTPTFIDPHTQSFFIRSKYFISNSYEIYSFRFLIFYMFDPTINISST